MNGLSMWFYGLAVGLALGRFVPMPDGWVLVMQVVALSAGFTIPMIAKWRED